MNSKNSSPRNKRAVPPSSSQNASQRSVRRSGSQYPNHYSNFLTLRTSTLPYINPNVIKAESSLRATFDILNVAPIRNMQEPRQFRWQSSHTFLPHLSPSHPVNFIEDIFSVSEAVQRQSPRKVQWRHVGNVTAGKPVHINTVVWPGETMSGPSPTGPARLRIATAIAPPFVMQGSILPNRTCLRGVPCLRVATRRRDELAAICADFAAGAEWADIGIPGSWESTGHSGRGPNGHSSFGAAGEHEESDKDTEPLEEEEIIDILEGWETALEEGEGEADDFIPGGGGAYNVTCCRGYVIDLLQNVARDLRFDYVLYVTADEKFGGLEGQGNNVSWNGVIGDIISGSAHLGFAPLSITKNRSEHVDFSVPFYFTSVSYLAKTKFPEVPLLAFLAPFSLSLWVAIFASLNFTAIAAAVYEWLSPFGLNPWGRQRTKNFSLASALWVTWSLLFSHLVAFKAPKSWPNKVLINLWGCFSVIFLASYTANIARLFAGLFFLTSHINFNDESVRTQRIATVQSTTVEDYFRVNRSHLWDHVKKYSIGTWDEGVQKLRDGQLDILVGDTGIMDYYHGSEPGCTLRALNLHFTEDAYGIATAKGSPLKGCSIMRTHQFFSPQSRNGREHSLGASSVGVLSYYKKFGIGL